MNLPERYAFGVCRIEPENNVHVILEAFASGECGMPLVMVGNWRHSDYSTGLLETYRGNPNVIFHEAIYDEKALNVLRAPCTLYVHGHSCGGTNPSLVEAMYLGLPIAAFDCNFNRETTENGALYFRDVEELRRLVQSLEPGRAAQLGAAMKEIADRRYTWKRIAGLYKELF